MMLPAVVKCIPKWLAISWQEYAPVVEAVTIATFLFGAPRSISDNESGLERRCAIGICTSLRCPFSIFARSCWTNGSSPKKLPLKILSG
jgi:hypothetical protein